MTALSSGHYEYTVKMESCGYSSEELKWGVKNIGGYCTLNFIIGNGALVKTSLAWPHPLEEIGRVWNPARTILIL